MAEIVSSGSPQGEETKKQAMPTALRQEIDVGRKQRAQKAHQSQQNRP